MSTTSTGNPIVNISKWYYAPSLDLARAADFLMHDVRPFIGGASDFSGDHQWSEGANVRRTFQTVESWSKAPPFTLESASASLSSGDPCRRFDISFVARWSRIDIRADVLESEKDVVIALIRGFEKSLGFSEQTEDAGPFRVTRRYLLTSKFEGKWLHGVLIAIPALLPGQCKVRYHLRLSSGVERSFTQNEPLLECFKADLNVIEEANMHFDCWPRYVRMHWNLSRDEFQAETTASQESEALNLADKVEDVVALKRLEGEVPREGRTRNGLIKTQFNATWFAESIHYMQTQFPRIRTFRGEFSRTEGNRSPRSFNDLERWLKTIIAEWDKIEGSFLSVEFGNRRAEIVFRHREESVELTVEAPSAGEADFMLNQLANQLKLEFYEDDLYSKAISSCTFAVKVWQGRAFAEAVRDAVPVAMGERHWVAEAWTKEAGDESQPLRHDKTLEEYLKRLQAEKRYVETSLRVEGPRGRALRIHVYQNLARLDLRSSLPQAELDNVAESLKSPLKLKTLKEAKAEGSGDDSAPKQKHWFLRILPVVGTALVTLVFTSAFLTELVPKYHVTILSPRGGKEDSKEFAAPEHRVEWQVQREFFFRKRDLEGFRANIRLLKDGNATSHTNQASGNLVLSLNPGSYVLTVKISELHASDTVYFAVKGTNSP